MHEFACPVARVLFVDRSHAVVELPKWLIALVIGITAAIPALGNETEDISYFDEVLPIFRAHCHGCHQPAKSSGDYDMTNYATLLRGGESEEPAIVPGDADASLLLELVTPADGEAEMPLEGAPLSAEQLALIRKWITQGAVDDSPAQRLWSQEQPPTYQGPPVITALEYSPDGKWLAVSGFHEVILWASDGSQRERRLIGISERIESVAFSPDGQRLAVTGGKPGRAGELQIWDVASGALELSLSVGHDVAYGASWSPDGSQVAVGGSDSIVRAFDSTSGQQMFFQTAHDDWVLDTMYAVDGSHLVTVGRDRTAKLMHIETERFIDNITSITPGALKGGIAAVSRHPQLDLVLLGGADGVPKAYRMHRVTKRVIGDDANLVKRFGAVDGRILDAAFFPDGRRGVAVSSGPSGGQVAVFSAEFDLELSADLETALRQVSPTKEQKALIEDYVTGTVNDEWRLSIPESGIYAVAVAPDEETIAVGGADGQIRLIDSAKGEIQLTFSPVSGLEASAEEALAAETASQVHWQIDSTAKIEDKSAKLPNIVAMKVEPQQIEMHSAFDKTQLVIVGVTDEQTQVDLTRAVTYPSKSGTKATDPLFSVSRSGMVIPLREGEGQLVVQYGSQQVELSVSIAWSDADRSVDFVQDVMPVMAHLGCNSGTCHGAKDGKNGFKLSLRGYDPLADYLALTDELACRRVNRAAPLSSLMLQKATGEVPHTGGARTRIDSVYAATIRKWISEGAGFRPESGRVEQIRISPRDATVQDIGSQQQLRVVATFADGTQRDVTAECFIESSNTDVAAADRGALVTTLRRGETAILARYEGAYDATTLTVMGQRSGFQWSEPIAYNQIDNLVYEKQRRMKIVPSALCTDVEFVRRATFDLTGLPPTPERMERFLADSRAPQQKRRELVDELIGSQAYIDYWTNKWADLLQVNRKYLGAEGAKSFRAWIRGQVESNVPYDDFVRAILTASGSNHSNPPASYYKILRQPAEIMENTTHLFLGVRFNCNKCHDHPFERWTQDQYYELAAYFARVNLKADEANPGDMIGGTAVEGGKPPYEVVFDAETGDMIHDRTGEVTLPEFPYQWIEDSNEDDSSEDGGAESTRRERLARWVTAQENQYFVRNYVNRIWGYLTGTGLIEPLDDIRAGNPPTNPALLDWLCDQFVTSGFDTQQLMRTICESRTYQLSIETNRWNEDDQINYSHAKPRRLPAEVLFDAVHAVTGTQPKIPGVPAGTRAMELPDAGVKLPDGFLTKFGRPARESACECERSSDIQMGSVISLVSGATIENAISDTENAIAALVNSESNDAEVVRQLYWRILNRPATAEEIDLVGNHLAQLPAHHEQLLARLEALEIESRPEIERRKKAREERIAEAQQKWDDYLAEYGERDQAQMDTWAETLRQAKSRMEQYQAALPARVASWEASPQRFTNWDVLRATEFSSTIDAQFEQLSEDTEDASDDGVIVVSGPIGKDIYTITVDTEMVGITGIRLEALADESLPKHGPGRSPYGNFVVSEFEVSAAPLSDPETETKVRFSSATADHSQPKYDVNTAIDGKVENQHNGWAIGAKVGEDHTAVFQAEFPAGFAGGSRLRIRIDQSFQDSQHTLGRFRLSATNDRGPLNDGKPSQEIKDILQVAKSDRDEGQVKKLADYVASLDGTLAKLKLEVTEAEKPLVIEQRQQFQEALEYAKRPIVIDAKLVELRAAALHVKNNWNNAG